MDEQRILRLVQQQARARDRFATNLATALARLWQALTQDQRYNDAQVATFAREAGQITRQARTAAAGSTDAYLRLVLAELNAEPRPRAVAVADEPRGIPWEREFSRPAAEYRRLRVEGLDELEAAARAEQRLLLIGDTDVALAARDASRALLVDATRVTGWRRVIHPELAKGGTCGLCIAAADRVYARGTLLPLHERCNCEVIPVVDGRDPAATINAEDISRLYSEALGVADGTSAGALAEVRVVVHEHGELGPVLRRADQAFRDAQAAAADTTHPSAAA